MNKESIFNTDRGGILLFDGGMGSMLQKAGLPPGELPEIWNITHPDVIKGIHRAYLDAGCDIVTTNTFGANPFKYPLTEDPSDTGRHTLDEVIRSAVDNAKAAAAEKGHGIVALDIGPTGRLLAPMGDLSFDACVDAYAEVVRIGSRCGADIILIETMSDMYECKAAILAAKENCSLPVAVTAAFDRTGKLLTGGTPEAFAAMAEGLRADALGLNCGLGPDDMAPVAEKLLACASVPVIIQPNAGLPRSENGETVYDLGADDFAAQMRPLLAAGASAAGGCCGTTPDHIRALRAVIDEKCREKGGPDNNASATEKDPSGTAPYPGARGAAVVTSFAGAVAIGDDPVIIGERINPTGKKRFQRALMENDMEYILNIGIAQQDAGAHILDVNVGIPGIDEVRMLENTVRELQSVTDLPLQLDSADPAALERAMRIYNGKPLINSVNGKQEVMDAVFPLAAKYGGVLVALCIDENGIPETAGGRIAIAKRIIEEAAKYGIEKKDLLIDALCMTISSDEKSALTTLEAVRRIRTELGARTVLGVSNISFGLPHREIVSSAFLMLALENGLNAAIINPNSDDMMRAFRAYRALKALDGHAMSYISAYGPGYVPPLPAEYKNTTAGAGGAAADFAGIAQISGGISAEMNNSEAGMDGAAPDTALTADGTSGGKPSVLYDSIRRGLKDNAAQAARDALGERTPMDLISEDVMPALDFVGQGFEKGTLFLPQLIMSAEAAKAAFEQIRSRMEQSGQSQQKKGRIVIATVKGDIHDIGKNIVKVLLENYNFEVIDLGKDVAPEDVVKAAAESGAQLIALSALMTTTVPAMEETVRLVHEQLPGVRVMVGGAVMTQSYAEQIGADFYSKDAMGAVTCAEQIYQK